MSKIVRRLNREEPIERALNRVMPRRTLAHMKAKHTAWPLGTRVIANTRIGRLPGKIVKHWRDTEYPHGCSVQFDQPVDLGDANGERLAHVIPFRNLKKQTELSHAQ